MKVSELIEDLSKLEKSFGGDCRVRLYSQSKTGGELACAVGLIRDRNGTQILIADEVYAEEFAYAEHEPE